MRNNLWLWCNIGCQYMTESKTPYETIETTLVSAVNGNDIGNRIVYHLRHQATCRSMEVAIPKSHVD